MKFDSNLDSYVFSMNKLTTLIPIVKRIMNKVVDIGWNCVMEEDNDSIRILIYRKV